jgi:hypothetical protein
MGKLVVTEFMTVDGVVEAPGGGEPFERGKDHGAPRRALPLLSRQPAGDCMILTYGSSRA